VTINFEFQGYYCAPSVWWGLTAQLAGKLKQ